MRMSTVLMRQAIPLEKYLLASVISCEEDEGENHINHNLLHRIVDGILLLTHEVGRSMAVPYPAKPAQAQAM